MISASHNTFEDNGIKFFSRDGFKLDDETERRMEKLVLDDGVLARSRAAAGGIGKAARIDDAIGRYLVFLKSCLPRAVVFDGIKVVIDCANGAAYRVAPEVLEELGADVVAIGVDPDGRNINLECGALHPERLRQTVLQEGANVGIALDGDADRITLIDEHGEIFDGDDVMAALGLKLAAQRRLAANTVVTTVMSNLGLEQALRQADIRLVRTEVGDPAVVREMRANSYNLGGEQSGHIIFMDHSTTGDGTITALMVLAMMAETGRPLSGLRAMRRVPQVIENVPVRERIPLATMPEVQALIGSVQRKLDGNGRLLVRYSGTEMMARVMIEGEDAGEIRALAAEIGAAIARCAGAAADAPGAPSKRAESGA